MKKTVLLVLTIVMASAMGGCSFFSDANDAKNELETAAKKPIPKVNSKSRNSPAKQEATTENEEEFADLESEDSEATQAIAGLIPATDPDSRVRSSVRGRQDPFSVVALIPEIEIEQKEEKRTNRTTTNQTNRERSRITQKPNTSTTKKTNNPIDEFRTKLAQEVIISGLYESNGRTKLIVRAPEEDNSRYVEVGQYLSNGQILVKSIDPYHFPTPMVTLEQSGVEITKVIGENPEDSKKRASLLPSESTLADTAFQADDGALLSSISLTLKEVE